MTKRTPASATPIRKTAGRATAGAPREWVAQLPAEAVSPNLQESCENVLRQGYSQETPPVRLEFRWTKTSKVKVVQSAPMLTLSEKRRVEADLTSALVIFKFTVGLMTGNSQNFLTSFLRHSAPDARDPDT